MNAKKTPAENTGISTNEIAHLAFLNWHKDGCPQGRDQQYWLEAEIQIKATRHLLASEHPSLTNGSPDPEKSKPKATRKTSSRTDRSQRI